jgi:hypothetical protein
MEECRYSSTSLNLSCRGRSVESFTLLQLYPQRNSTLHPLYRRLGGPQSRSGRCGEEPFVRAGDGTSSPRPARGLVTIPTELSTLLSTVSSFYLFTSASLFPTSTDLSVCLLLVFRRYPVRISAQLPTIRNEDFRGFPQCFQINARIVHEIRPRPLPSTSFPIHYLLLIPYRQHNT